MKKAKEFDDCAERLKALADSDRLRIINLLFAGEKNVGEIAEALSEEIVNVSHHLGILRRTGILIASKHGRFVVYSLNPDVFIPACDKCSTPQLEFGCCRLAIQKD